MMQSQSSDNGNTLSIIVVSYNTKKLTIECLESVFAETKDIPFEVIVVDNASEDGSADAIQSMFPQVRLICSGENMGFAKANNLAIQSAEGEYLLLLNSDTVVLDRAIDKLVCFARARPEGGIWGGRTLFPDGELNPTSCWGRITLWSIFCRSVGLASVFKNTTFFNPEAYGGWRRDTVRNVDIVTGCFLLIRKRDWDRLEGFNPEFFMFGEEADLCLRAQKLGMTPAITPEATIIHYGGASSENRSQQIHNVLAARIRLIRDHFPIMTRHLAIFIFSIWPFVRMIHMEIKGMINRKYSSKEWHEACAGWRQWLRGEFRT